jgi:hypothetical protein
MYSNALSGLASGMASGGGAPMGGDMAMGGMGEMGESEMVPCPMCQGVGMVPADMMGGGAMLPPRLAARGGGMGMDMGGAMQMPPSSNPSPFPMS